MSHLISSKPRSSYIGHVLNAREFSYNANTNCFVAEDSTLRSRTHGLLYPDAADIGFLLESHRTSDLVPFYQCGVDMNGDEVAGWRYAPVSEAIALRPHLASLRVLVIND